MAMKTNEPRPNQILTCVFSNMQLIIKTIKNVDIKCSKDSKTALKTELGLKVHELRDLLIHVKE